MAYKFSRVFRFWPKSQNSQLIVPIIKPISKVHIKGLVVYAVDEDDGDYTDGDPFSDGEKESGSNDWECNLSYQKLATILLTTVHA